MLKIVKEFLFFSHIKCQAIKLILNKSFINSLKYLNTFSEIGFFNLNGRTIQVLFWSCKLPLLSLIQSDAGASHVCCGFC